LPLNSGRLTGIARIDPVNVPTLLKLEVQTKMECVTDCDPLVFGDEL